MTPPSKDVEAGSSVSLPPSATSVQAEERPVSTLRQVRRAAIYIYLSIYLSIYLYLSNIYGL